MKPTSRKYNRVAIDEQCRATGHDGREQGARSNASTVAAKSVLPALPCPYGAHPSLTSADHNGRSWYNFRLVFIWFVPNERERKAVGDGNSINKIYKLTLRQKVVKCFYSEQKAIKTEMSLTYKEINNAGNAVKNLVRSVTNRFISKKFGNRIIQKY